MMIIYVIFALSIICVVFDIVVLVKIQRLDSKESDISSKDFDRLESKMEDANSRLRQELAGSMAQFRTETSGTTKAQRDELGNLLRSFQETFVQNMDRLNQAQKEGFSEMERRQKDSIGATELKLEKMRETVEQKLDEMRATVDEKLQKTLNDRLGQSFKMVSEQLENVQKGLGEMKNLASDVGGLKNALTNVKVRGNFGELQLKALLEQMLSPEQYDENVATIPGSSERVEFAVKLPGKDEANSTVYLPIDSKFPKDVYDQYIDALDAGDAAAIKVKSAQFESTVKNMAKDVHTKYVSTPHTTDFAILFVPVENIYAEVIRRSKLTQDLRDTHHVLVTGPTTLGALLSSLQMGFRTLAIERRSSEVWKTLAAVKTEFSTFGDLLEKAKKNLDTASSTIELLQGRRTRAINRKLSDVETLPMDQAAALLPDVEE